MEYGIPDSLQLEAEWDAYIDADATEPDESGTGQGNLQLGLMYSLIDIRGSGFHFAAGPSTNSRAGTVDSSKGESERISQELYLIFAKDLEEDSKSQLFLQAGVELQQDGRRPLRLSLDDLEEDDDDLVDEDDDHDIRHDPNVWFLNIGGYGSWNQAVLSLELNLSEEKEERYLTPGISYHPMDDRDSCRRRRRTR